jgi:hypothetical protein
MFSVLLSLVVIIAVFLVIVYHNSESRNLVLSFSAIVGAVLVFYLNVFFELKDDNESYFINTELSIFHEEMKIGQHFYPPTSSDRLTIDNKASQWLVKNNPELFKSNTHNLMTDLIMYSFVGFFLSQGNDWKKITKSFSQSTYTQFRVNPDEKGSDSFISKEILIRELGKSNNVFANVEYEVISNGIFLPPKSEFKINDKIISIDNPFSLIRVEIDESGSVWYGEPGSKILHLKKLEDGSHKYETRYFNINISIIYKAQRAKNKQMSAYKNWVNDLIFNAGQWFSITGETKCELHEHPS